MTLSNEVFAWRKRGTFFNYRGKSIFYIQEGQGDTILIVHGYPYSSYEWKEMLSALSDRYKVIALDLLGMGFSDKPKEHKYSFEEHANIINALLSHIGIEEAHILSHDLGVSVAQELLARVQLNENSFTIRSSVFLNGGLFMDAYKPRLIQKMLSQSPTWIGKLLSRIITKRSVNKSVKSVYGMNTQPTDKFLDEQWEVLNFNDGKSIAHLIGRLVFDKAKYQRRWIEAMQKTTIPMCFINGPSDPNSGIHMAERYRAIMPNPNVFLLRDDIGHWPHLEDTKNVLQVYLNFIKKVKVVNN